MSTESVNVPSSVVFLERLARAVDEMRTRSGGHPAAEEAAEAAWRAARRIILAEGGLVLSRRGRDLLFQGQPIEPFDAVASKIHVQLSDRRIEAFELESQTTVQEFRRLLSILVRSAADAVVAGSLRPALVESFQTIRLVPARRDDCRDVEPAAGPSPDDRAFLEIGKRPGVTGVSRLVIEPRSGPERTITLVYHADRLDVVLAAGDRERTTTLPIADPRILPWEDLRSAARRALPLAAQGPGPSRARYRHRISYVADVVLDAVWIDPEPHDGSEPSKLVDYYESLVEIASAVNPEPASGLGSLDDAAGRCALAWSGLALEDLIEHPILAYLDPERRAVAREAFEVLPPVFRERLARAVAATVDLLLP